MSSKNTEKKILHGSLLTWALLVHDDHLVVRLCGPHHNKKGPLDVLPLLQYKRGWISMASAEICSEKAGGLTHLLFSWSKS